MTGVTRAVLVLVVAAACTGCATKAVPPDAGQPHLPPIVLEDVPRHVDGILMPLQTELLAPVRLTLRAAKVSTSGVASDGSYSKWLTALSETIVAGGPLPKNFAHLSSSAYKDLARIIHRPKNAQPVDLMLLGRRLEIYFQKQSSDARRTAAAYIEGAFSISG